MKENEEIWPEMKDIDITENIKQTLLDNYSEVYNTINKILSVKIETDDRTMDQMLFDIMEKKNKVSTMISDIIKESSVDCIQNTRDDFNLNQRCLRFSEKLLDESTIFPGITAETMNAIDIKQIKTNFIKFIEPNLYVIMAKQGDRYIYIYYELNNKDKDLDIRYVRENGKRICDIDLNYGKIFFYEDKIHEMNKILGAKFSIFQTCYIIKTELYEEFKKDPNDIKLPEINDLIGEDNIHGFSIKYNVNEKLFYKFVEDKILRLYDYKTIEEQIFTRDENLESIIIYKGNFYLSK